MTNLLITIYTLITIFCAVFGFYMGVHYVPKFCSDFKDQKQAQSAYDENFKLYQHLDGDGDKKVCENL